MMPDRPMKMRTSTRIADVKALTARRKEPAIHTIVDHTWQWLEPGDSEHGGHRVKRHRRRNGTMYHSDRVCCDWWD